MIFYVRLEFDKFGLLSLLKLLELLRAGPSAQEQEGLKLVANLLPFFNSFVKTIGTVSCLLYSPGRKVSYEGKTKISQLEMKHAAAEYDSRLTSTVVSRDAKTSSMRTQRAKDFSS